VLVCTSTGAFALGAAAWGVLTDFVPDFTGGTAAPRIGMLPAGSWNSCSSIDDEHAAAAQLPTPVPLNSTAPSAPQKRPFPRPSCHDATPKVTAATSLLRLGQHHGLQCHASVGTHLPRSHMQGTQESEES